MHGRENTVPAAEQRGEPNRHELLRQLECYRIQTLRLEEEVLQLRTLLRSGKQFSELTRTEVLLDSFMSVCREHCACRISTVLLLDDLDPRQAAYRVRAQHGLPDVYVDASGALEEVLLFRIPQDTGSLWQLLQQSEVFSVRDLAGGPRFPAAFEQWSLDVLQSEVWVPLLYGGQVLGILTLGGPKGASIPREHYPFLREVAMLAATNIDSTLKHEKNAKILGDLQTLYDVNQQLGQVNDFKRLTSEILATAVQALKAQKANLMLYNAESRRLEIKVVWGQIPRAATEAINAGRLETKSFAYGEGVAGRALESGKPIRLNDRAAIAQVSRETVHCILAAPLLRGGEPIGVITLTNKVKQSGSGSGYVLDTLGRFGEDDERLLVALADQASANLHKARLYSASITDRLTGLHNARHFETTLDAALQAASEAPPGQRVSLALVDIDHFKRFNDTYGHKAGDHVLAECARLLRECARQHGVDGCFRYGGEEFCLVLPGIEGEAAARVAEGYRRCIEDREMSYEGQPLRVTVSVGVATFPGDGEGRVSLFQAADRALYGAKNTGRNRVSWYRAGAIVPYTSEPSTSNSPVPP